MRKHTKSFPSFIKFEKKKLGVPSFVRGSIKNIFPCCPIPENFLSLNPEI